MAAIEIILLVCGIICIVVSFIFDFGEEAKEQITTDLTAEQKDKIRSQITQLIDEELEDLNEKTEASLDKISNTKILELNDYAENILGQINRNHNETVFLYDMLNAKSKEIKNTVRDVNTAKRQVELMRQPEMDVQAKGTEESALPETGMDENQDEPEVKDAARERLAQLVRKSNEKARKTSGSKENQAENLNELISDEAVTVETKATPDEQETAPAKRTRKTSSKTATAKTSASTTVKSTGTKATAVKTTATKSTGSKTSKSTGTRTTTRKTKEVQPVAQEAANMNIQFEKGANNNDKILKLFSMGVSNKDIAKQLNLGVGEVKLVIDLYTGGK